MSFKTGSEEKDIRQSSKRRATNKIIICRIVCSFADKSVKAY